MTPIGQSQTCNKANGFEPHWRHCIVSLSKTLYPLLLLVYLRKPHLNLTEKCLLGRKESKQTNKIKLSRGTGGPSQRQASDHRGCTLNYSCYVGLKIRHSIYCLQYQAYPKKKTFEILATPQKESHSVP